MLMLRLVCNTTQEARGRVCCGSEISEGGTERTLHVEVNRNR